MTFVSRASSSAPSSRCSRTDDGAPMASRRDSRTPHQTAAAPSPGLLPRRRARRPRGVRAPTSRGARRGRTRRCSRSAVLLLPPLGRRLRSPPGTRAPRGARGIVERRRRGAAQCVRNGAFLLAARLAFAVITQLAQLDCSLVGARCSSDAGFEGRVRAVSETHSRPVTALASARMVVCCRGLSHSLLLAPLASARDIKSRIFRDERYSEGSPSTPTGGQGKTSRWSRLAALNEADEQGQ